MAGYLKINFTFVELPHTLLLQPNVNNDWIDVWSAYPYSSSFQIYNRFYLSNFSFQYDKEMISAITDLNGLPVTGAFIHYPPYTAYYHVVSRHSCCWMISYFLRIYNSLRVQETQICLILMSHFQYYWMDKNTFYL